MSFEKPLLPVKPTGMEIIWFYGCPFCHRQVPLPTTVQPGMARCDKCGEHFPIAPVDDRGVRFMKLITADGKAAVHADFL